MLHLDEWLVLWQEAVVDEFGPGRVRFMGIQGSRARGEAHEGSDIDVVLILDELTPDDLVRYRASVAQLPERDKLCGFVSGEEELSRWQRSELFQFCLDTTPLSGTLDTIAASVSEDDIRGAALTAACGVYHACVHNCLHERSEEILQELYKSVFFALRAIHRLETGESLRTRRELCEARPAERSLIEGTDTGSFDERSARLLEWSAQAVRKLG